MHFAVELSPQSERDLELIFDHLFESYLGFGESFQEAFDHAQRRLFEIRKASERLSWFPIRGTPRNDIRTGVRHLTIDKAIYWFDVDEAARKVRILAVFFGGQDHVRHMLIRLLGERAPP